MDIPFRATYRRGDVRTSIFARALQTCAFCGSDRGALAKIVGRQDPGKSPPKTNDKPMKLKQQLIAEIQGIIAQARERAIRSVDAERVLMYWQIGKIIFEEEQQGEDRAAYGSFLIKGLAEELQPQFGSGFSVRQLERYRQFYRTFPIASAVRTQLNWTQYKVLISIENKDKRAFYIAESVKNNWSARQLERQVNSQLFERLLLSNDVESVLKVARTEKMPTEPKEIIKDPMVLEFLGLKRQAA